MADRQKQIPEQFLTAINAMLAPFGVDIRQLLKQYNAAVPQKKEVKYLTIAEIQKRYGLGRWTIWRLIRAKKIVGLKMSAAKSGKVLVDVNSLDRYLQEKAG